MREFLEAVWGSGPVLPVGSFGEIRTISTDPEPVIRKRFFVTLDDIVQEAGYATNAGNVNVYFGVLPRIRMGGKAEDVGETTQVLWADVDAKKADPVLATGKWMALSAINSFPIPPQIIVDTGHGYHAYWLLEQPVLHLEAVPVMRWIAKVMKGDDVHDKSRILRLPGTYNRKREPVLARVLRLDLTRKYRFGDFESLLPLVEPRRRPNEPRGKYKELPEWLVDVINDGAPQGTRSETCFRVMIWLLRYGRTPAQVREVFVSTPNGIGEKYAQKPAWDADRWLDYSLSAAESVA